MDLFFYSSRILQEAMAQGKMDSPKEDRVFQKLVFCDFHIISRQILFPKQTYFRWKTNQPVVDSSQPFTKTKKKTLTSVYLVFFCLDYR